MVYVVASSLSVAERQARAETGQAVRFVRSLCVPGTGRTYQFQVVISDSGMTLDSGLVTA